MKKAFTTLLIIISINIAKAQHQEIADKAEMWRGKKKETAIDTTNLLYAFKKGQVHGHFRYFFMTTNNQNALSDYYANAIGGGIKYETAPIKGFQFGISGFYVYNIGSSNFTILDSSTNQANRYEMALFDVTNPSNENNINRLEELYLKYSWKKSHLTIGKQLLNTPFINLQDGRMRPTEVGGIYGEIYEAKKLKIEGGYLYQISPRSTVEWYKINQSIGIASQGINIDGTKGNYKNNISSNGIALIGAEYYLHKNVKVKMYEMYVGNIFNTILLQGDYNKLLTDSNKLSMALQYLRQYALNNGGNIDQSKTYIAKGTHANIIGVKVGIENSKWQTSVNYCRVTSSGRYQMPREWGRDPFFTFLPRERNEGLGDVHAYVIKTNHALPKIHSKVQLGIGYYDLPAVDNYRLNKYGMPSYTQINIDFRHEFTGFFKGLDAQFLMVHKINNSHTIINNKYIINKVNMTNFNVVMNYHF